MSSPALAGSEVAPDAERGLPDRTTKDDDEIDYLVREDREYVALSRYGYSIDEVVAKYPDGAPLHVIARALHMTEDEVEALEEIVYEKLRGAMGIEE
jgi:hypothetical protein